MIYVFKGRLGVSLRLGLGIALMLLLGLTAAGQCAAESDTLDPQAPDLANMSIEDLMNLTVVTSGKKPEAISQTAAAVFVITSEDIERYGYQTLAQAVRRISGFYSETDRYIDFIGLRGYLPNSDLNRRVLVLVDGHKVNDYVYGQAPVDQDLPVDLQDLDRIEIVKGPGSALWGSEALLCVINCITKKASNIDGIQIRQDLGFREGQHLAYGQVFPGGIEVSGTLSALLSDGQKRIYFPEYDNPATNNGVAEGLDGEQVGRGYLNVSHNGFRTVYDHVKRWKDVPTAYWWDVFNAPGTYVIDERQYWEMSYENPTPYAGNGKLMSRIYHDNYDGLCGWNTLNQDSTLSFSRTEDHVKSWGAEVRYSRDISHNISAIVGAEHLQASATRLSYDVNPYVLRPIRYRHFRLFSYYMQTDWDVTDSLRLVAGTRLDDHVTFGKNWSPRAGLIYKNSPKSTLKLLYGEAFRNPSMSETGGDDNPKGLGPEKIRTTEFVWEQQMGENQRLVTSLFSFDMYDVMLMTPTWDTILGSVVSRGIETQYDCRLRNGSSGYLGLSVVNAKSADIGFPLPSSPRFVGTCGISIPVFRGKANLALDGQYIGRRKTLANSEVGGAMTANLALTSHSLIQGADVSLGIWNLFNTTTFAPGELWNVDATETVLDKVPQVGRMMQFQISKHF